MASTLRRIVNSSPVLTRMAAPVSRMKSVALTHVPVTGEFPRFTGETRLKTGAYGSFSEFEEWMAANADQVAAWKDEDDAARVPGNSAFTVSGHCTICDEAVDFLVTSDYGIVNSAGEVSPNWREQLVCPRCHMCNRIRAALHLTIQDFGATPGKRIYITEQFGNVYRWLRGHFNDVLGSEYLASGKTGLRTFGINHQDVQALSLETASVDLILSFDVLEHVPDYPAAFASFSRVLRPGGRLVMTVPFTVNKYETTVRAAMQSDGQIEHFLPIEIHGNPLDPANGSLCFRHFGWDTLEKLNEAGFTDARVHVYHDRDLGYLGGLQSLITAVKE
jgi:SAM-dependent methyltransferase